MQTGLSAWKIAKGLYIMPLFFAYTPLLGGTFTEVMTIFAFALVGMYALTGAIQGFLEARLNLVSRTGVAVAGILLLWPANVVVQLAGLLMFAFLLTLNVRQARLAKG
ncbi:MAG: hypothetical protein H8E30_13430 [Alphaproteobacteria bacterium]|nr:hypothetical protein [Alphaproteobacteria bacterium]